MPSKSSLSAAKKSPSKRTLRPYHLTDRYTQLGSPVYASGLQTIVRLLLTQKALDQKQDLTTAGFVSGYRGSPLGGLDAALWQAQKILDAADIKFHPGINEDLAATAVWGTQQAAFYKNPRVEGVFGLWYAKGPGVDRSGDALKHANHAGTSPRGGVLALIGDDHGAKSSSLPHQSDYVLIGAGMPILAPSTVQEILDFGLLGWAMSRYSGCWVGMKLVSDTVEAAATLEGRLNLPGFILPGSSSHLDVSIRWPDTPAAQEQRLMSIKLPAAQAFARSNGVDAWVVGAPHQKTAKNATLGIITAGKSYLDVRQALHLLGLDDTTLEKAGVRLLKLGMIWPIEPSTVTEFCQHLHHVVVVEEKRGLMEDQIKAILYSLPSSQRPSLWGKTTPQGEPFLKNFMDLEVLDIAKGLVEVLQQALPKLQERLDTTKIFPLIPGAKTTTSAIVSRVPYYCSGCPHNTSTLQLPQGSRALAGIGCHYMAMWITDTTHTFTHMGGEGVTWVGAAPFCGEDHVFVNLGDGTYYHSGTLAIRQALAAKSNVTYKILYNDAVAMTGGQPVDGPLSVAAITHQMAGEGVTTLAVVTDDIYKYPIGEPFAHGTTLHPREELNQVQERLKHTPGVTVLIYDQTCAAEKRRRRRRRLMEDPPKRVFIHPEVCEGCGDCGRVSNCVSIVPLETELGTKRAIDQSSCNKDYSCVKGFCPSFITVEGDYDPTHSSPSAGDPNIASLDSLEAWVSDQLNTKALISTTTSPTPSESKKDAQASRGATILPSSEPPSARAILVAGVGGTGMVTIGALVGTAAHLDYKHVTVMDQTGLAQKGGSVYAHIKIADHPHDLHAHKITTQEADVVLACDVLTAAQPWALSTYKKGHTKILVNTHETLHAAFTKDRTFTFPMQQALDSLAKTVGAQNIYLLDAHGIAQEALGDSLYMNLIMLGFASEMDWLPVTQGALQETVILNGASIKENQIAFRLGQLAAAHYGSENNPLEQRFPTVSSAPGHSKTSEPQPHLEELLQDRYSRLIGYQNELYALKYRDTIHRLEASLESKLTPVETTATKAEAPKNGRLHDPISNLTRHAAINYYKLLAYKDEYEVARLWSQHPFLQETKGLFSTKTKVTFHLAPPFIKSFLRGERPKKYPFGPWMLTAFKGLAWFKFLRGTRFDPFGYSLERRQERWLIKKYENLMGLVARHITQSNAHLAEPLLTWPQEVRGFGPVKEEAIKKVIRELKKDEEAFRATIPPSQPKPIGRTPSKRAIVKSMS